MPNLERHQATAISHIFALIHYYLFTNYDTVFKPQNHFLKWWDRMKTAKFSNEHLHVFWPLLGCCAIAWIFSYIYIEKFANWLTTDVLRLNPTTTPGSSIEFFLYDTLKILLLLIALIYIIALGRAALNLDKARDWLTGKKKAIGYFLAALLGSVTPFCSCSSIPLFLGFNSAGIPFGVTMAFLITSPIINEIAVVLLWGLLGWKFTLIYIGAGLACGIVGGFVMDWLKAERWLQPFFLDKMRKAKIMRPLIAPGKTMRMKFRERHNFAWAETRSIFRQVWLWVIIGVGIGAAVHGYVPDDWFAEHFSSNQWWTVPAAVMAGIPLYSSATGIVPVMESLLLKGLPLGTTLAFCMSAVAASIPEAIMLRKIMTAKLQATFLIYLWIVFSLAGWLFNLFTLENI